MKKNNAAHIPARFLWAADVMNIRPTDQILEVGCGRGQMAELVTGRLKKGSFTAIDQSALMIKHARNRNQEFINSKQSFFLTTSLEHWNTRSRFNKIFAFNVSLFWKNPEQSLPIIKRLLKPGGQFFVFFQPPVNNIKKDKRMIAQAFEQNNILIEDILVKNFQPAQALCFITRFIKIHEMDS